MKKPKDISSQPLHIQEYINHLESNLKKNLDLLNWAKSELNQELNPKLGKSMNPYRREKIVFLRRIIDRISG